jgi:hypothetical protein
MAAAMSQRKAIDALARRLHELAKQNRYTGADAEADGAKRRRWLAPPLFDDAFVIACYNDMPRY